MRSVAKTVFIGTGEDSRTIQFPRLDITDILGAGERIVSFREATARTLAKEEKMDRLEIINLVLEIRTRKPTIGDIYANCKTPAGAIDVLKLSLGKAGVPDAQHKAILSEVPIQDLIELAGDLILDVQEDPAQAKKDADAEAKKESPLSEGGGSGEPGTTTPAPTPVQPQAPSVSTSQATLLEKARGYGSHERDSQAATLGQLTVTE